MPEVSIEKMFLLIRFSLVYDHKSDRPQICGYKG